MDELCQMNATPLVPLVMPQVQGLVHHELGLVRCDVQLTLLKCGGQVTAGHKAVIVCIVEPEHQEQAELAELDVVGAVHIDLIHHVLKLLGSGSCAQGLEHCSQLLRADGAAVVLVDAVKRLAHGGQVTCNGVLYISAPLLVVNCALQPDLADLHVQLVQLGAATLAVHVARTNHTGLVGKHHDEGVVCCVILHLIIRLSTTEAALEHFPSKPLLKVLLVHQLLPLDLLDQLGGVTGSNRIDKRMDRKHVDGGVDQYCDVNHNAGGHEARALRLEEGAAITPQPVEQQRHGQTGLHEGKLENPQQEVGALEPVEVIAFLAQLSIGKRRVPEVHLDP
mmetsp:Transcript_17404/g.37591  ORF Transcript_17404/g.37591 Transcript_17404/m.37591 type:complete len:336 (+) Transcript_17404:527-1534(+)